MKARNGPKGILFLPFCQLAIIVVSVISASFIRFDFSIPAYQVPVLGRAVGIALVSKGIVFLFARLLRGFWSFATFADLYSIVRANLAASVCFTTAGLLLAGPDFPQAIYLIDLLVCLLITASARFAFRLREELKRATHPPSRRVLIYGAGSAGMTLAREIRNNPSLGYVVAGFLDDDRRKWGANILDIPVLGNGRSAAAIVERFGKRRRAVSEIVIALPSANWRQMREALANCRATGVPCKFIPSLGELLTGKVLSPQIRSISVTDLLTRAPVQLDEQRIFGSVEGRVVLVTGAGGSIGSELCRQIARFRPARLVGLDQAESDLFRLDMELRRLFLALDFAPEIGDIRDPSVMQDLIGRYSVASIFHAAAYKHVPLMEAHVFEALRNNVLGTYNVARAAYLAGVSDFLLISSDKAVNPVSIMGATKRAAELVISAMQDSHCGTRFVSVRFGNVLGSVGSVVPIFQAQIAAREPVTVTHPDVRRYFMTIPEAVQLVLQASTMGQGGEVFVLDMGESVRIVDLARNMIRLAGLEPDKDIEIRFTGLRAGEKLFEELAIEGENVVPTYHEKIKIFRGPVATRTMVEGWLHELRAILDRRDGEAAVAHLTRLVPEYQPNRALVSSTPPNLVRVSRTSSSETRNGAGTLHPARTIRGGL